jgi:uncharacterized protein (TIGR01777 family)
MVKGIGPRTGRSTGAGMKAVIAGGSGTLGRRVANDFAARGYDVVILTRSPRPDIPYRQVQWDGRTVGPWAAELAGAVLLNMAGELVDRRPTPPNIDALRRSRVDPTTALVKASAELTTPPKLWLQMSTLAIYGDGGQDVIDESHPVASGPPQMAGVARPWEQAAQGARAERTVVLRTGIVLDRGTPAFDKLAKLTRLGLGGRISTGEQWISWIHIDDFLAALWYICDQPAIDGVIHLTAPEPIQNRGMMSALRTAMHRPWSPPTPKPLVYVGAYLMRSDPALALTGRRCVPRRLLDAGFAFVHPTFGDAVEALSVPTNEVPPNDVLEMEKE